MVVVEGNGTPVAAEIASASCDDVTPIEPVLGQRVLRPEPLRLLHDTTPGTDPLRVRPRKRGIELICKLRKSPNTQESRASRQYKRSWTVGRSISWLQSFRRVLLRYEHNASLVHGLIELACRYSIRLQSSRRL